MYSIDRRDTVALISGVPQSSIGAPLPLVVAKEGAVTLAYLLETRDPAWDGSTVRVLDGATSADPVAIIAFRRVRATLFGPPNDEAFHGHPLYDRGLRPYGAFEVTGSSWCRSLERMNRVHPHHHAAQFDKLHHYIWAFHDSVFECLAQSYEVALTQGPLLSLLPRMGAMTGGLDAV